MPEMRLARRQPIASEYVSALVKGWWSLVVGLIGGLGYLWDYVAMEIGYSSPLPRWLPLTVALSGVFVAQFLAFAEMRKQRDDAIGIGSIRRPKLKLSTVLVNLEGGNAWATHLEAQNFDDDAAVNVRADITIPDTAYAIRIELTRVAKDAPQRFMPQLFIEGKAWRGNSVYGLEHFMQEARLTALANRGAAARSRLQSGPSADHQADHRAVGEGMQATLAEHVNVAVGPPLIVDFDVAYSNYDRTLRYRTPHVLVYDVKSPKDNPALPAVRIDLADTPEPEPIPSEVALRASEAHA